MAHVFVQGLNQNNAAIVAEMFEFDYLPRVGEHLFIDDGNKQHLLEVKVVRHFPVPTAGSTSSGESAHLDCKWLESWDRE
jgi:hypothetical protein